MILVDTGPLVAIGSVNDVHHDTCTKAFTDRDRDTFLVSPLVVTEVCQLLERRVGPEVEARFLDSLVAGPFQVPTLAEADMTRMAQLVRQYRDFPLGAADASVVALAERLEITTIMTLDHRHFRAVRPLHRAHLEIVP